MQTLADIPPFTGRPWLLVAARGRRAFLQAGQGMHKDACRQGECEGVTVGVLHSAGLHLHPAQAGRLQGSVQQRMQVPASQQCTSLVTYISDDRASMIQGLAHREPRTPSICKDARTTPGRLLPKEPMRPSSAGTVLAWLLSARRTSMLGAVEQGSTAYDHHGAPQEQETCRPCRSVLVHSPARWIPILHT